MLDWLFIIGHAVVWYGALAQALKVFKTKSTKSIAIMYLATGSISMSLRLPLAWSSDDWAFQWGYVIGWLLGLALLGIVVIYRKKYPKE